MSVNGDMRQPLGIRGNVLCNRPWYDMTNPSGIPMSRSVNDVNLRLGKRSHGDLR